MRQPPGYLDSNVLEHSEKHPGVPCFPNVLGPDVIDQDQNSMDVITKWHN